MKINIQATSIIDTLPKPKSEDDFEQWYKDFQVLTKPYHDLEEKLKSHPEYDFYGTYMFLEEYGSKMFNYFLEQTKTLNGHQFIISISLEKTMKNGCLTFIIKSNREFPTSYDCNALMSTREIPFYNDNMKYPLKIAKELRLKKFTKISDDRIYEDYNGFIISKELAKKFQEAKFSGYELTPVKDCRGKKEHDNIFCLTATNILPPSEHNALRYEWQEKGEENKTLGYVGTLIYNQEALKNRKDFNYPCEATSRDGRTDMLVSKEFKEFCEKENIKGVDFIPVFTKESDLYKEYVQLVKNLCKDLVNSNPKHRIGFSKIDPAYILDAL